MFAFIAEGAVVSLIVRELSDGTEQLTVGVKSGEDVLWTTTRKFTAEGEPVDGKVSVVVVDGAKVRIGSTVKVAGQIAFYTPKGVKPVKGKAPQRNKAFNLTKLSVAEDASDAVERLVSDLAF